MRQPLIEITNPSSSDMDIIWNCLRDVTNALGYLNIRGYNIACIERPWEVMNRIIALR